jgi:DNA-binding SARP family transcriptional activator
MRTGGDKAQALDRPTSSQWPVLICLLGGFQLLKRGLPVKLKPGGKAESLLTLLVLEDGIPVTRDLVIEHLWPNIDNELAVQSLHSLTYSLQKQLSDVLQGQPPIVYSEGHYHVNEEAGVGSDIRLFESLAQRAQRRARMADPDQAIALTAQAIELYRGDLAAPAGMRSVIAREQLRARYLTMLASLADHYYSRHDYISCLNAAQQILASDPCREDAHRLVMICHVRMGERSQALRQYTVCRDILRAEFDAGPEQETVCLFDRIRLDPSSI